MRFWTKLAGQALTVATATSALIMVGALPSEATASAPVAAAAAAVTAPSPVSTTAGTNFDTADPGVLLDGNHFYAFSTGSGLRQFNATEAGSGWSTPAKTLTGALPSWADSSKALWAPDMIKTTSNTYVVYFSAALTGTAGNPPGADLTPAAGARCIGTAEGMSPLGKFTADPTPLVCFDQFHPADGMDANPGDRTRGEGVIDPSPVLVTVGGQQELFLLYKTQADPSQGEHATIRMVQLSATDGVTKVADSKQLLSSSLGSFADTIEAPTLIQHGSSFILFVAHGNFDSCNYSTQWYKSTNIWSWTGAATTLLNQASTGICGPGTADITGSEVAGQSRIFLNGWVAQNGSTITSTPYNPGPNNIAPVEGTTADRVLYSAVITWSASDTPQLGEFLS